MKKRHGTAEGVTRYFLIQIFLHNTSFCRALFITNTLPARARDIKRSSLKFTLIPNMFVTYATARVAIKIRRDRRSRREDDMNYKTRCLFYQQRYIVTWLNEGTRALTRVRCTLEYAWWKKGRKPSAQAPVKAAFVKRFYALCPEVPATCFRGSLCDNSPTNVTQGTVIDIKNTKHRTKLVHVAEEYARLNRECLIGQKERLSTKSLQGIYCLINHLSTFIPFERNNNADK